MSDDIPLKRCSGCPEGQQWHPATTEFFTRNKSKKDGLDSFCKACNRRKSKAWHARNREMNSTGVPAPCAEERRCSTCPPGQEWHPATTEFFHSDKKIKDGFARQCKVCVSKQMKAYYRRPDVHEHKLVYTKDYQEAMKARDEAEIIASRPVKKWCPACEDFFPATEEYFHRNTSRKDGLCDRCKECANKEHKVHYALPEVRTRIRTQQKISYYLPGAREQRRAYDNRPDVRQHRRAWERAYYRRPGIHERFLVRNALYRSRPRTREQKRTQDAVYRNRPDVQERLRVYFHAYGSRPDVRERKRIYHQAYDKDYYSRPGVRERYRVHDLTRRARKKAVSGTHTAAQIAEQLKRQHYCCYYAACDFSKFPRVREKGQWKYVYHVEHTFPLSRVAGTDIPANDMSYLVLACGSCNDRKGSKFPWEWPEGGRLL